MSSGDSERTKLAQRVIEKLSPKTVLLVVLVSIASLLMYLRVLNVYEGCLLIGFSYVLPTAIETCRVWVALRNRKNRIDGEEKDFFKLVEDELESEERPGSIPAPDSVPPESTKSTQPPPKSAEQSSKPRSENQQRSKPRRAGGAQN